MNLIYKLEKPIFFIFVAALISATLLAFKVLPVEFKSINPILFFVIGLYYVPVFIFAKISKGFHRNDLQIILSNFAFGLTCGYMAIVPFIQVETLGFLGNIVGIINGVLYIYFQLHGRKHQLLFIRHLIVTLLVMTIVFMTY